MLSNIDPKSSMTQPDNTQTQPYVAQNYQNTQVDPRIWKPNLNPHIQLQYNQLVHIDKTEEGREQKDQKC